MIELAHDHVQWRTLILTLLFFRVLLQQGNMLVGTLAFGFEMLIPKILALLCAR